MSKKNKEKEDTNNIENIVFEEEVENSNNFKKKTDLELKKVIKQLKIEKKEYLDGWQRARAEIINLKKVHEEEKKLFTSLGKESFLREIIPILDNFEAAFSNQEVWEKVDKNWRIGIEYIYQQFLEILTNNGVKQIGKVGENFDEKIHSALENIITKDLQKNNQLAEIIQKGYQIKDKIIREAKVKIFFVEKNN